MFFHVRKISLILFLYSLIITPSNAELAKRRSLSPDSKELMQRAYDHIRKGQEKLMKLPSTTEAQLLIKRPLFEDLENVTQVFSNFETTPNSENKTRMLKALTDSHL